MNEVQKSNSDHIDRSLLAVTNKIDAIQITEAGTQAVANHPVLTRPAPSSGLLKYKEIPWVESPPYAIH
jgi:hypothetical protein